MYTATPSLIKPFTRTSTLLFAVCMLFAPAVYAEQAAPGRGAEIYANLCASCHGDKGQGVRGEYSDRLIGDHSVQWLANRIERSMPEGDEDACVGEDASAVAQYIYDAFYSPQARAGQPETAAPELQHLTVEQHRQTLADLVAGFRRPVDLGAERGLRAQYFKGRELRKDVVLERIDAVADVRFTAEHPLHDRFDPKGHSVRWSGSLLAPVTGEYEIIIRSDQAVRLWLNDGRDNDPLIDGWVQSEGRDELRRGVYLLAGRAYPLVLEYSSHTQGVQQDKPDGRNEDGDSHLALCWKLPHRIDEVVPQRFLAPVQAHEVFVCDSAFPPDDASYGYERGVAVSEAWLTAATDAAVQAANYIADHLNELADTRDDDPQRVEKTRAFSERLVERALRRPLDEPARQRLIDASFADVSDPELAVKRVVLRTLGSPRFLYPGVDRSQPDDYDAASRLALAVWDSLPDDVLLQAASRGELSDAHNARSHATRMLNDPRARAKIGGFFEHWLELERAEHVAKDDAVFPAYDEQLLEDLRVSLELFIEDVVWSERSDYRELLLADYLYVNDRLGAVYSVEAAPGPGEGFARVQVARHERSGVITHPYLLTAFAYHNNTSPIHRGVFLTRNIVGRPLKPPPNAIEFTDAEFDPELTMREKVTAFTRDQACMACHATINPLGFSLEHYDGIGRWRTREKDKPIDAESEFIDDEGGTLRLRGARDVAEFAVGSDLARRAFVRQLFAHTIKHDPESFGADTLGQLEQLFEEHDFHIRRLYAEIAARTATHGLASDSPAKPDDDPHEEP